MSEHKSPRVLGTLIALLGAAMALGGIQLVRMGDNAYFVVVGLGVFTSGIFVAAGKAIGLYIYVVTLLVVIGWSVYDVGLDLKSLLPRIFFPILLAMYLLSKRIRNSLS